MTETIKNKGYCYICDRQVEFASQNTWLRDWYKCSHCGSIPRERALMYCIDKFYPQWRNLSIHESSPGNRGASIKLKSNCPNYQASQYFTGFPLGKTHSSGWRNENLENQTFADDSFDLVITQDVMEHIFHPEKAFSEIARTLKPGGAHIFTVPIVNKEKPSRVRATLKANGQINYLEAAQYHGNPVSPEGSLVTRDWGYDICEFILKHSGLYTTIVYVDDISLGIRAEYIEVLISRKIRQMSENSERTIADQLTTLMNSPENNNTSHFSMANKLMREGKLEEAIACDRRAIAQNPNFAWSHHNLGEALVKQGQPEEAIASYRRAIEINPNLASFHHHLREALVKPRIMANTDEGMVDIFTTVSRDNSSEKLVAQALEKPKSSKNYVICFTERSGSSMLCSILKQTNLLGMPNEYVNPRVPMRLYLKTCPATTLEEYFDLLRRTQTTPNGIFGLKSCFFDFKPLIEMGGVGKLLNPVQFIYLTRRDIILQAISGYLARKSGIWNISSQAGGTENLDYSKVEYDEEQILKRIDIQIKERLEWERFFTLYSIEPLRIFYEDIVESPITCVKQILSFLGENTDLSTENIKPVTVKLGGKIAQDYSRRLRESFTL